MSTDILSASLGGFSPTSTLLLRTLDGFYLSDSVIPSGFTGFDYPLTVSINNRLLTVRLDQ